MDPKSVQLDPKLREAYERVMGTSFPSPTTPSPAPTQPGPTAPQNPIMPSQPIISPKPVTSSPIQTKPVVLNTAGGSPNVFVAKSGSGKGGIPKILLVIGAILFFAVYTIVWMYIFKIPIPFLSDYLSPQPL